MSVAVLQPLMDNLESQTYEVFEKDPFKYSQYQKVNITWLPLEHIHLQMPTRQGLHAKIKTLNPTIVFISTIPISKMLYKVLSQNIKYV